MSCMANKAQIPTKKETKELGDRLTIRLTDEAREHILYIQSALADSVRGGLSVTDALYSALRIARNSLNVPQKR